MSRASKWTIDTLKAIRDDLKAEALRAGRYPPPHTPAAYASRRAWNGTNWGSGPLDQIPYRCIAYETTIRRITAINRAIEALEAS